MYSRNFLFLFLLCVIFPSAIALAGSPGFAVPLSSTLPVLGAPTRMEAAPPLEAPVALTAEASPKGRASSGPTRISPLVSSPLLSPVPSRGLKITPSRAKPNAAVAPLRLPRNYAYVLRKLRSGGVGGPFAKKLAQSVDRDDLEQVIRLNVLGFLQPKPDYSGHLTAHSVRKCRDFMKKYAKALQVAQRKYKVPGRVIAALTWVETRHGANVGNRPVVGVYMNLAMADHPIVVAQAIRWAQEDLDASDPELKGLAKKVTLRCREKAAWAVVQIQALQKMAKKHRVSVFKLNGSYAGAFGIPQFIPASYISWGVDGSGDHRVDLFRMEDAILSTAHYLRQHGFSKSRESRAKAIHFYNRSDDYVHTIMELADLVLKSS